MTARIQRALCRLRGHIVFDCSDGWYCGVCDKGWDR